MALYLGGSKPQRVILDGVVYKFNLVPVVPITNGIGLLSSDGYVLKDSEGLYITINHTSP